MDNDLDDDVRFDDLLTIALAESAGAADAAPGPDVKRQLMARLNDATLPAGFNIQFGSDEGWRPHPVPGIRMKVLSVNPASQYATLLLDVAPGTRFPPHHHSQAEECYVLSGSLFTCGQHLMAGDFVHADARTDHGELWTEEGCRVLLVVEAEDYMVGPA